MSLTGFRLLCTGSFIRHSFRNRVHLHHPSASELFKQYTMLECILTCHNVPVQSPSHTLPSPWHKSNTSDRSSTAVEPPMKPCPAAFGLLFDSKHQINDERCLKFARYIPSWMRHSKRGKEQEIGNLECVLVNSLLMHDLDSGGFPRIRERKRRMNFAPCSARFSRECEEESGVA